MQLFYRKLYRISLVCGVGLGYVNTGLLCLTVLEEIGCNLREQSVGKNILLLLKRNGIKAEDAVYVGDTAMDEAASRRAGIRFVHASYGFGEAERPDAVIREMAELPGVLETL